MPSSLLRIHHMNFIFIIFFGSCDLDCVVHLVLRALQRYIGLVSDINIFRRVFTGYICMYPHKDSDLDHLIFHDLSVHLHPLGRPGTLWHECAKISQRYSRSSFNTNTKAIIR
jgi:hypothetical protein